MFGRIYKTFNVSVGLSHVLNQFFNGRTRQIKRTFLVSIAVFELGSLICAVANHSWVLILGRAVAGVGVSGIISGSTVITAFTCGFFPGEFFPSSF
jgi:MFS family permease